MFFKEIPQLRQVKLAKEMSLPDRRHDFGQTAISQLKLKLRIVDLIRI